MFADMKVEKEGKQHNYLQAVHSCAWSSTASDQNWWALMFFEHSVCNTQSQCRAVPSSLLVWCTHCVQSTKLTLRGEAILRLTLGIAYMAEQV